VHTLVAYDHALVDWYDLSFTNPIWWRPRLLGAAPTPYRSECPARRTSQRGLTEAVPLQKGVQRRVARPTACAKSRRAVAHAGPSCHAILHTLHVCDPVRLVKVYSPFTACGLYGNIPEMRQCPKLKDDLPRTDARARIDAAASIGARMPSSDWSGTGAPKRIDDPAAIGARVPQQTTTRRPITSSDRSPD